MAGSLGARLYLRSHALFRILHGGSQALFEGFWMGLLSESAYDVISQKSYGEGAEYTSARWLDSGLFFWEEMAVTRFFKPGCRVLVGAAGGGREVIGFARLGFVVDGFECSPPMVAAAQKALAERGIPGKFEWAPPCHPAASLAVAGPVYDACIVGWNGYTYIAPRQRRIDFLKQLRHSLRPDAPVLVSGAFETPGNRVGAWTVRVANFIRVCTLRRPIFERGDAFSMRPRHSFTRPGIESELTEAGFTPAAYYRWGPFGAVVGLAGAAQQPAAH